MSSPDPLLQVVYLARQDFNRYRANHMLPSNGAFIESVHVPVSMDAAALSSWAEMRLAHHEAYRSSYWNAAQRTCHIQSMYVEWVCEGTHLTRLVAQDSVFTDNAIRMKPVEDVALARQLDPTKFALLPANALEAILRHSDDVEELRAASETMHAQLVLQAIRKLFVVVDWST
jgi:hypothetical protein